MPGQSKADKLQYAIARVNDLETALSSGAALMSISIDGTYVQYDRKGALAELEWWRKQVYRLQRSKSRTTSIRLDNQ